MQFQPNTANDQETAERQVLYRNFARQVWEKMTDWTQQLVQPPQNGNQIAD